MSFQYGLVYTQLGDSSSRIGELELKTGSTKAGEANLKTLIADDVGFHAFNEPQRG